MWSSILAFFNDIGEFRKHITMTGYNLRVIRMIDASHIRKEKPDSYMNWKHYSLQVIYCHILLVNTDQNL